jgi:glycosyltransferase involved in cell wall biosynthesis
VLKNLPRLLFFVPNEDYFLSHRLPMARAAIDAGYRVGVITNAAAKRDVMEAEGLDVLHLAITPGLCNPFNELKVIHRLYQIYKDENPHVVHHVTLKAITYGGIAAFFAGVPHIINAIAGLGYIFNSNHIKARILRLGITPIFRFLLRRKKAVLLLQNKDDLELLIKNRMAKRGNSIIIPGSGVELEKYTPTPLPSFEDKVYCAFSGRMIGIKGLDTLQKAFAVLKESAPHIMLRLCGVPDANNPGSWSEAQLKNWAEEPNIEWLGFCSNMPEIWQKSHIALQPSDGGEGIPKALLEAAACGRPLIATDVPGCREVVEYAQNGYLIPPRDPEVLADAILKLANDKETCQRFAEYSPYVIRNRGLSATDVQQKTKELYESFLA